MQGPDPTVGILTAGVQQWYTRDLQLWLTSAVGLIGSRSVAWCWRLGALACSREHNHAVAVCSYDCAASA
jgi:hypothetical protein